MALQFSRADRCLNIIPYYHGMGLHTALLSILFAGGTVICIKDFIPSDFFFLVKTLRPTCYVAGPAHHQAILREIKKIPPEEWKKNSLRLIVSSSASLPAGVSRGLETLLGVGLTEQYALSETGVISINIPPRQGSVGFPVIEHVAILDEDGNFPGEGNTGEIVVKGDTVFSGYEDAPEENAAAFTDGWFRTGDMGYLDRDVYLFLSGRKKELINKGGEKISPEEIDTVLKSHPRVRDAMTFGIADPVLGEDVAAMVVPADDHLTETDLRRFLLDRLVQFKIPRKIRFVDRIPRTPTGKPQRHTGSKRYS
jgi:acyl-CoA synthetase (AMP-forming)/AMP-acid ligase II